VGIDPSVALFTAGIGTLIFHLITRGRIPVFLGSSFAFIAPLIEATKLYGWAGTLSGIIAVGLVYGLVSVLVKMRGIKLLLFGMIASIGIKSLVESKTNMAETRNQVIVSVVLTVGIGGAIIQIRNIFAGRDRFGSAGGNYAEYNFTTNEKGRIGFNNFLSLPLFPQPM